MASEPKCDFETPLSIEELDEIVATEFDEELLRELLEEPQMEMEIRGEPTEPSIEANACDDTGKNEGQGNNHLEFDWSEINPKEPSDTNICSMEDYGNDFIELGNSGDYSYSYDEDPQDETAYVGLW